MKNLSQATKIVLIVSVVVLALGVLGIAAWSGEDIGDLLKGAGAWVAGVVSTLIAKWFLKSGKAPLSLILLAFAISQGSCAAQTCQTESTIVSALDSGIDASAVVVGDSAGEDWDIALSTAQSAVDLGQEAVRACENARDGAGWQEWVGLALRAASTVASFIDTLAGPEDVDVPPELTAAIAHLEEQATEYRPEFIDE